MLIKSRFLTTIPLMADITSNRLEAFSDGVMAIIITIMVLELKIPHGAALPNLLSQWPVFSSYALSFIYVAIYWNNHHHMFLTVKHVNGGILWANMHLLFWLSLIPFVTGWMGENHYAPLPTAMYGVVLLFSASAYFILQLLIIRAHGKDSILAKAVGNDLKGKLSPALYVGAILSAFIHPALSGLLYIVVACMWLVPDRRIERALRG